MHLSWQKHLELSRTVSNCADDNTGFGLALMGIALTMLARDLLLHALDVLPSSKADMDANTLFH